MTFDTLMGRLERLKRLAEIVKADDYAKALEGVLGELEGSDNPAEVDPALLSSLRRRLLSEPPEASEL